MTPPSFVLAAVALTLLAYLLHRAMRHRLKAGLRQLARQHRLSYVQDDLFGLGDRIAGRFPVPGGADIRILDVLYATQGARHRYLFTAEYTRGVINRHVREAMVLSFCEASEGGDPCPSALLAGDETMRVIDQYEAMLKDLPAAE